MQKVHTEYSLLEGVGKIEEYIEKAKRSDEKVLAITDTGLFGAVEFYRKCRKSGIKAVMGLEVFLDGMFIEGEYCLTLMAKNENGYRNLCRLSSASYSRFSAKRHKIKYEELKENSSDLFILSGGVNSEIVKGLEEYRHSEIKRIIKKLRDDFGESFFVEIPVTRRLERTRKYLIDIVEKLEAQYVVLNDAYYVNDGEAVLQKIMASIKSGNRLNSENSDNIEYDDLYLKTLDELKKNFDADFYNAGLENIEKIVENCNAEFEFNSFKFPKYELDEGVTEKEFLRKRVFEGLSEIYINEDVKVREAPDEIRIEENLRASGFEDVLKRAKYELEIIDRMGYNGYFIIVWDFIRFARENGIYVGPGRGSAAGSLVSYALGITEIDPLKYNLIFERFLNPERISMPDIDIDFDQEQRELVIDYVFRKYGKDHVAHIITFGTLKARAAIRDVGRVLDVSLKKVDRVTKMIPFNMDLQDALENIYALKKMYSSDTEIRKMIDYSIKIEGRARHASVHAAGVVISKERLGEEIPVYSDGRTPIPSTQYQMKELEDLGILKIDFLGLKNLTILRKSVENIGNIELKSVPLNDVQTFRLMTEADTLGIFQCESFGIRQLMKKMKINTFEDIIALLALYRPGPLKSGMVDDFIRSKNESRAIKYIDESLKDVLKETYGVILYQEQVMRIASEMADYTLGEADELRRAIGKKIPEIMAENREKFVKNALNKGFGEQKAGEVYNLIEKFGGYGFNKSHSAAYAMIAYWTAYFKTNYPTEFFAAVMSTEMYNIERLSLFINEARSKGIKVLLPDVNLSEYDFKVEKVQKARNTEEVLEEKHIRFGLIAIKGIGINTVNELLKEREKEKFSSFSDFVYRMKKRGMNRKNLEAFILSGSLDGFGGNRNEKYSSIDKIFEWSENKRRIVDDDFEDDGYDQYTLIFGKGNEAVPKISQGKLFTVEYEDFIPEKKEEMSKSEILKNEKEYLGIYISSHPLEEKANLVNLFEHTEIRELQKKDTKSDNVRLIGILKNIRVINSKSSREPMAKFEIEDFSSKVQVVCFPKKYVEFGYRIKENEIVILEGRIDRSPDNGSSDGRISFIMEAVFGIEEMQENKNLKLYVLIDEESRKNSEAIKKLILENRGMNEVFFALNTDERREVVKLKKNHNVNLTIKFLRKLAKLVTLEKIKLR